MSQYLRSDRKGQVLTLTLNQPEKRNPLGREMVAALRDALDEAATDDGVRVIVLTGEGKAFSAGADLAALERLQSASRDDNLDDSQFLAGLFERIYRHPKPIVAAVNGHAIAGGCGLAAVCDFSVVVEEAKLGFTEVRIGFVPAIVSIFVLRKLGEARARDLLLRGHLITAREAAEIGLIDRVVAGRDLERAVADLAAELATEASGTAVERTKKLIADIQGLDLDAALDLAAEANADARSTEDCRAGVAAFLNKEQPPWKRA